MALDLDVDADSLTPEARSILAAWIDQEEAERAEGSLHAFVRQMWRYVDPAPFKDNWHIRVICEHLEAVTRGDIRRLLINIPPRHSKSLTVAVMWPAWTWIQQQRDDAPLAGPQVKFMSASYAHTLSIRDAVKSRRLIDSQLYQQRWGDRFKLTGDQNTKTRFENDAGGYRLATSVGGTLTGEGGDIILIDDPHNVVEADSDLVRQSTLDWWDESMSTRLNDPDTGAYVIIMQRVHHQDLAGHVIDKGGWTHLCLPARYEPDHPHVYEDDERDEDGELLWPERFSEDAIRQLEIDLGSYGSAGQLQQRPSPRSGGMFDPAWWGEPIGRASLSPGVRVRGWDLAASIETGSAYTAGSLMRLAGDEFAIEHMVRVRGTPRAIEDKILETAKADGPHVIIDLPQDPGQAGKAQVAYLKRKLAGYNVRSSLETGSKEFRAGAFSAQVEAGNVKLVRGPWNRVFIDEAALFPNSDYSDQVDASSRAFHRLTRYAKRAAPATPIV